jgi:hypothetical protein
VFLSAAAWARIVSSVLIIETAESRSAWIPFEAWLRRDLLFTATGVRVSDFERPRIAGRRR